MANGPPPPREEQQKLLQDARDKRDTFAQEKARVENLLNSTLEKVKLYRTLLSATESLLCSSKDLIRSIRFRLQQRGISTRIPPTHALMATTPLPTYNETVDNSENDHPPNDHPSGTYSLFTFPHPLLTYIHRSYCELDPYRLSPRSRCTFSVYINTINSIVFSLPLALPYFPYSSLLAIIFSMPGRRNGTGKQVASAQSQPPANRSITSATPTLKPSTRTLRPRLPPVNPTQAQPGSSAQGKRPFSGGDSDAVRKLRKTQKKVHRILCC